MRPRGKVLVVDDDPLVLKLLRARLEGAGFAVITRDEALGTTQVVIDEQPDVAVFDLRMPALAGDALATLVKKNAKNRNLGIILHSSEDLLTLQQKAQEIGALGAIAKTGDDEFFLAQFERLFSRAKRQSYR